MEPSDSARWASSPQGGRERYQLLGELGRGGHGVVYRARDLSSGREVALKVLLRGDPHTLRRFEREVEAARRLDHPHLVKLLDVGVQGGKPYLATELVGGGSLASLLERGPLAPYKAVELLRDAARAVQHAHDQGVLHRDLKPENVLVDARGARVVDFGLARLWQAESSLTQSGALVGTGPYIAPEQARGERDRVGPRSDVYGLGATLYEALTGRPPFVEDTIQTLLEAVTQRAPTPPRVLRPELSPQLERICLTCLAKDPGERFATAGELAGALQDLLDGTAAAPAPPRWRAAALAGLLALVGLGGVGVLVAGRQGAPPTAAADPAAPHASATPTPTETAEPSPQPTPLQPGATRWVAQEGALDVRRAGPWALLLGGSGLRVSRGEALLEGPSGVGPAAAWDAERGLLWLAEPQGLLAWEPGAWGPGPGAPLPWRPFSLALVGETLLAASAPGELWALDPARPASPRWKRELGASFAGPLGLDLDGDGRPEHLLVATSGSRLTLLDLADGAVSADRVLPSPARYPPLLLGPAEVLVACQEGQLARYAVEPARFTPRPSRDLQHALATAPVLLRDGRVLVGTRDGWLLCLETDLEGVAWAVHREGFPAGELAVLDLDQDGAAEVCCAWIQPHGNEVVSQVLVCSDGGRLLLELPCGARPFLLAGGGRLPLIGAGADARAWGPWTALTPRAPAPDAAWDQLAAGAFAAARRLAATGGAADAALVQALADWHLGAPAALDELLRSDRAAVERALRPRLDALGRRGDLVSARRLALPLGWNLRDSEPPALTSFPFAPLGRDPHQPLSPEAALVLELREPQVLARGLGSLEVGGGRFRASHEIGLLIGARGRLRLGFSAPVSGRARLRLLHRGLPYHVAGYASVQLLLDGQALAPPHMAPWSPPGLQPEQLELGRLEAGDHTLELVVLPRAATLYCLGRLELELLPD